MARPTSETDSTIEGLLHQRAQYEQWLTRLDATGDKAPPAVRTKVRNDYEARLRGVIDELRGHAATIAEELDRHRSTQAGLDHDRRHVEEDLAEAEVRHAVGEYGEEEWRRMSDQANDQLGRLRGELSTVGGEIARLAEVQSLIGGPPKLASPPPPAPAPVAAAPEPEPEPEPVVEPPPAPAAKAPSPRPSAPSAREPEVTHGPPPPGDELAFIKSVAPEEERKPAAPLPPRRASNPGSGGSPRAAEGPASAGPATAPGKPGAPGVAKTLKCGECGTLNRPTEWYCERCGAELAGL